jgi:gluconolactonase
VADVHEVSEGFEAVEWETVATGLRFPEGPIAMADGSVVLVEIARGTLSRVSPDGSIDVVAECGAGPNGAAVGPDGAVYVTNNGGCFEWIDIGITLPGPVPESYLGNGSIQRVDLATGEVTTLYTECDGRPLRAPNDLVFDAHGGMWFTDHGLRLERSSDRTGVFYARADGSSITEVVFPLDAPNGVGLSPSGDRLYVAETHTGRLFWWAIPAPGEVLTASPLDGGGSLLYAAPGSRRFDSLAVDGEGWVCVGTLGEGGITAASPDGRRSEFHPVPDDPVVTNICFAGAASHTAFVTASATGRLLRGEWPRSGLDLAHSA